MTRLIGHGQAVESLRAGKSARDILQMAEPALAACKKSAAPIFFIDFRALYF
jgi:hypothetical protein